MRVPRQGVASSSSPACSRRANFLDSLALPFAAAKTRLCGPSSWPRHVYDQRKLVHVRAHKQVQEQANKTGQKLKQLGPVQRLLEAQDQLQQDGISISELLQQSLIVGLTFGTAFQVTHNNGLLPVRLIAMEGIFVSSTSLFIYDVWPIKIGPFLESGLVPLVLAPIWLLYGYLAPLLDQVFAEDEAIQEAYGRATSLSAVALTWILCAAQFIVSDIMYLQGLPHWQIYPVMAASTAAIWATTDRTKTGLGLSALLAVGAPLGEAAIVALGLWHYERPDNPLGICYWTGFCYASYAYGVANFARWQVQQQRQK